VFSWYGIAASSDCSCANMTGIFFRERQIGSLNEVIRLSSYLLLLVMGDKTATSISAMHVGAGRCDERGTAANIFREKAVR
jgi:hypothetical protein